jgi:hypothetical protein
MSVVLTKMRWESEKERCSGRVCSPMDGLKELAREGVDAQQM